MTLSRRDFLRLGALTAASAGLAACQDPAAPLISPTAPPAATVSSAAGAALPTVPPAATPLPTALPTALPTPLPTPAPDVDPLTRLVSRAGYGHRLGKMREIRQLGFDAYLEAQLHPETLDDGELTRRLGQRFDLSAEYSDLSPSAQGTAANTLIAHTLLRQLHSPRQLYEAMVEFWSDHFHIYPGADARLPVLKLVDDLTVIRPNALTTYKELLAASVRSPAMLVYLDNFRNGQRKPNENYARELLELHTVGIDAGYSQADVIDTARILTGWTVIGVRQDAGPAQTFFALRAHDDDAKTVLGTHFPAGQGEADLTQLLDMLATHPATARHISTKLVRRFVADDPPPALVQQVSDRFLETGGDIKSLLRTIFTSPEFAYAPPKLKRPHAYLISLLRALGIMPNAAGQLKQALQALGQPLFQWPAPNGYPDVAAAWANNLLPRWNVALATLQGDLSEMRPPWELLLAQADSRQPEALLRFFGRILYQAPLTDATLTPLLSYVGSGTIDDPAVLARLQEAIALLAAAPPFQWT